ncbi:hypothetical protein PB7211_441 [Candidatus Pelagibacter sp. HTCC7211]|jgi:hypothetical protein|uniref:hypothetical protein n=1 Tax=Pelagibacter sp. (strain HTCC7211) TaxID=439493 RepID=UPI0000255216|nr:hypothetical protein [Candidatus Pelagibacter sp. HTCC7211]EDZ60118.1 hypothetical protein PB7211_441 [Candidatus Pelagibacter sp. HTCC7211]|tara:strand:+ start:1409 stop:1588 length:180 start_codon:yes stop_codon:yes gene_type:complete
MNYLCALRDLAISLIVSTIIIYALNIIAGFAGADYTFTNGEAFIIWILMAILVNNCMKR